MTFTQWLASRIDAQQLEPELERSLRAQFDALQQPVLEEPHGDKLVIPTADCQWPQKAYWTATVIQ